MRCAHCDSPLPEGAAFCIECGAPTRAATDRTIQLEMPPAPGTSAPAQLPSAPARRRTRPLRRARRQAGRMGWGYKSGGRGGAIFLIGLGVLLLSGYFWPGIVALIGVVGAVEELDKGNSRAAARALIFFGGLTVLFTTGAFWPGILIILGLIVLAERIC